MSEDEQVGGIQINVQCMYFISQLLILTVHLLHINDNYRLLNWYQQQRNDKAKHCGLFITTNRATDVSLYTFTVNTEELLIVMQSMYKL